jgi:hypothetical protein
MVLDCDYPCWWIRRQDTADADEREGEGYGGNSSETASHYRRALLDPAATKHERTNAETLKIRLEKQLTQEATPEGTWTNIMYLLGRAVKKAEQSTSPPSPKKDWTNHAFRLGRMRRRGLKK